MVSNTDPVAQLSAQPQFAPQGAIGSTLGNILGSGVPYYGQAQYNPLVNWNQAVNPFNQIPQYGYQQQIAPQGAFGQQLGGVIGSLLPFNAQQQYNPIANWAQTVNPFNTQQQYGQVANWNQPVNPFNPFAQNYNPQQQFAPQGAIGQQLGGLIGSLLPFNAQQQYGQVANWNQPVNPFNPFAQSYNQQQQVAPQGAFGQQLGGLIGSLLPFNAQQQYGQVANWNQPVNPFNPFASYYNQNQQQVAPQGAFGQQLGGLIGSLLLPFNAQQQYSPVANWTQGVNPFNTIQQFNPQSQWTRPYWYGPAQSWFWA